MSFTLEIVFMGLVAFVPAPKDNRLTILVPDATEPAFASDGSRIPVHRPLLVYECRNVGGGKCKPADRSLTALNALYDTWDEPLDDPIAGGRTKLDLYGVRNLVGVEIQVHRQKPGETLDLDKSFKDIPDFSQFDVDSSSVESGFLDPVDELELPYKDLLAARIAFSGIKAKVTAYASGTYRYDHLVKHRERNAAFDPAQEVSTEVYTLPDATTVTVQIDGDYADVVFTPFPGSTLAPPLRIEPFKGSATIMIMNFAICDKWEGTLADKKHRACYAADSGAHGGSDHFEMYYHMPDYRPPAHLRMVPVLAGSASKNGHTRPICPPAQFPQ